MKHKIFKGLLTFLLLILTCSILTFLGWMFIYHLLISELIMVGVLLLRILIIWFKWTYNIISKVYDNYRLNK